MPNSTDYEEIVVSIICITYNHEKYIRDALEGFVKQKTHFRYEIIVHDDCSTDATRSVIEEYYLKYPELIVPVFEKENLYSQGIKILSLLKEYIRGKYVAFCEGDDYWCDEKKLQKQVDFLENHSNYSACAHSNYVVNCIDGTKTVFHPVNKDIDLTFEDISLWHKDFFHTSSVVFRKEYYDKPSEFSLSFASDYPYALWLITKGKIRFFKECMSVYRANADGSYSRRVNESSDRDDKIIRHANEMIEMLIKVNSYNCFKYDKEIHQAVRRWEYEKLVTEKEYLIVCKKYKNVLKIFYGNDWIKYYWSFYLKAKAPALFRLFRNVYRLIWKI